MSNFERRFGKYAIPNLTLLLIIGYAIGYFMQVINGSFLGYLTLDPYLILHGQVWRIVTWLLIPPAESNFLFVLLMLFCCYSIGNMLERTWGTYKYNVYIFGGVLLTVLFAFLSLGFCYLAYGAEDFLMYEQLKLVNWYAFGTYYINVSIYLGFAMTYPESTVRLYFIIPVKMKWLGWLDLAYMAYALLAGNVFTRFAVAAALVNVLVFYLINFKGVNLNPKQVRRKVQYTQSVKRASAVTKHKCAVCGQTDESNPNLEFRFCSKCNGNYEYCNEHIFTHTHVKY